MNTEIEANTKLYLEEIEDLQKKCKNIDILNENQEDASKELQKLRHELEITKNELSDIKVAYQKANYDNEQLLYEQGQLKDENVFYSKLIEKVKSSQTRGNLGSTDNRKISELEENLVSKTKQYDLLKEKHDSLFNDLNQEKDKKEGLMRENSSLNNQLIQKDAELMKSKTDKFIKEKISEKPKDELYRPIEKREPTSEKFYEIIECQTNKLNSKDQILNLEEHLEDLLKNNITKYDAIHEKTQALSKQPSGMDGSKYKAQLETIINEQEASYSSLKRQVEALQTEFETIKRQVEATTEMSS